MRRNCKLQLDKCKLQIAERPLRAHNYIAPLLPPICNLQFAFCFFQFLILLLASESSAAPADDPKPPAAQQLLDRTPFDQIQLNAANGNARLEVLPLTLPQRPLTAIPTTGSLKVRLLDRPTEEFEVAWTNIAQVRIFEEVLLDEAARLTQAGKFDEAYDYYKRLGAESPSLANLDDAICNYLRLNALALYQAKQHDRALALLLTLYQRNPTYAALPSAVETVAGEVIQKYLREGDYAAARRVLDLWQTQFRNVAPQTVAAWQTRFESAAGRQVADANSLLEQKQYIPARKAVGRALAIWPNLESATQTMARIDREFPYITVGVLETSPRLPRRRIDDWATLRTSALTQRLLAEEIGFGSEGGDYRSPLGDWKLDESGRELTLKLNPVAAGAAAGGPTTDAIARYLLALATPSSPSFRGDLAALVDGVSIAADNSVVVHLKRVHVRPESLLQLPPPAADGNATGDDRPTGPFSVADHAPDLVVFAATNLASTQPAGLQAIVEQTMPSDEAAVAALLNGEVDVLDRVPPWQLARLRAVPEIQIGSYTLPTVHVLIPNLDRPLPAKREFRRALCYGIDRKWIVDRVLLGGGAVPGFEAISGPFPAGTSLSDPIRYGYNSQIAPRPFEPRLASILATVAWSSVQNPPEKNKDKTKEYEKEKPADTNLPELTLAHPKDPVVRVACQTIQAQLAREGIPVKLREFTADELIAGTVDCDLRYAELAIWEPVTDARHILGPHGLAGGLQSAYLDSALRNLDTATNWKDVRARLAELHEIANHELPVIPLWQTVNFFAYRSSVRGIGDSPVTLYQNVEQWSAPAAGNVAQAAPGDRATP